MWHAFISQHLSWDGYTDNSILTVKAWKLSGTTCIKQGNTTISDTKSWLYQTTAAIIRCDADWFLALSDNDPCDHQRTPNYLARWMDLKLTRQTWQGNLIIKNMPHLRLVYWPLTPCISQYQLMIIVIIFKIGSWPWSEFMEQDHDCCGYIKTLFALFLGWSVS